MGSLCGAWGHVLSPALYAMCLPKACAPTETVKHIIPKQIFLFIFSIGGLHAKAVAGLHAKAVAPDGKNKQEISILLFQGTSYGDCTALEP